MSVIQHTNTREDGFEQLIERALVGTTIESRRAQGIELNAEAAAAQTPSAENFYWGLPKDFLHREAVDERRLWSFLTTTQADLLDQWRGRGGSVKDAVIKELKRTIESRGVLDILKNGLEVDNLQASKRLRLFYPKPTAADSAESHTKYASNQFSITRQAIEEGFILDVVTNYTTYHSFYEVVKNTDENPEYDETRAQKLLRKMVEREPHTIEAKAEVMLNHFDAKIVRSRKLKGKAKAMVVTKDIECAIRYYHALRKLAEKMHLRYNILVAFSGEKTVDGVPYTERGLNGFADTKTAEEFDKDDNRILVVANKYLTGFDQPKLAVMYVDKPLGGVLAVQTLSRLNRNAPDLGKRSEDVFVLDFFNTVEGIKEAFDPFYTSTTLEQATDPNVLSELRHTLLDLGVFTDEEIEEFNDLYLHGADQDRLAPLLDAAQHRYDEEIEWPENGKADFKMKCKQFVKVYSRIAAIMAFDAPAWEKMYWYLRHLIPQLRVPENGGIDVSDLLDKTDLNTYCLSRTALNEQIVLNAEEAIINPLAPTMVNAGGTEEDRTQFDIILQHFNERHMNGWDATPEEQRTKVIRVAELVRANARYLSQVVGNPDTEAADRRFQDIIDEIMLQQRSVDMSLYREFRNEGFRHDFINLVRAALENGDRLSDIRFQRNPDDAQ